MIILLYLGPMMFDIQYDMINAPFQLGSNTNTALDKLPTNRLVHYTFLFNAFMMMNIFNQINCRKLGIKEFNIFERIFNNPLFILIVGGEFVAQWGIVTFGGTLFRTTPLPFPMVLTSILLGVGSLIVAAIVKATPPALADKLNI